MAFDILPELAITLLQLVVGLVFSMGAIYIALRTFDMFTKNIDEWKEMKKGNTAVGILLGGIILSISLVIERGVSMLTAPIRAGMNVDTIVIALVMGLVNLIVSLLAAVVSIYVAIKVLDIITTDVDEMAELKKGNIAVAIMMVAVLISVSFVVRGAVDGIATLLSSAELLKMITG
ncbi:MAG: DUF350 domain-containing protein [Candidatus ainarchaeum sp.]|nr:DUF350 domain-containing protein [Candidatus ainarchaeum sp.]